MSHYIELEKLLLEILDQNAQSTIKTTENIIYFKENERWTGWKEDFIQKSAELISGIHPSNGELSCWCSWLTDFTLKEYFRKMDNGTKITEIDLTGNDHITDLGIIWICPYLKKRTQIEKIILRSCSKLTETSLHAILSSVNNIKVDMSHTNVRYISENLSKYYDIDASNCFLGYTPVTGLLKPMGKYSIIIWPSKATNFNGMRLFSDPKIQLQTHNYFELLKNVRIGENIPLANVFNYKMTEVPVHLFVPKQPGQVIILLSDTKEEAVNHLIEAVTYFLASEFSVMPSPTVDLPALSTQMVSDDRSPMQIKLTPKKQKTKREKSFQEEKTLLETSTFSYRNIQVQDKTIQLLRNQGVWVSKVPLSKMLTNFGISSQNKQSLDNVSFGFCQYPSKLTSINPIEKSLFTFDTGNMSILYLKGSEHEYHYLTGFSAGHSAIIKSNFKPTNKKDNSHFLFISIEVADKLCWSYVFTVEKIEEIVPFLYINEASYPLNIIGDWEVWEKTFSKKGMKLNPTEPENIMMFLAICSGPQCHDLFEEISKLDWKDKLSDTIKKIEELIDEIKKKEPHSIDFSDCKTLGEAIRQLDNINNFISKIKERLFLFKVDDMVEQTAKNEILSCIGQNIQKTQKMFPYKFLLNIFEQMAQNILNLGNKYVTIDQLLALNVMENVNNCEDVLQNMFTEGRGIYIKKFKLFILDISWFDSLLHEIITKIPFESEYRLLGVHSGSKVWTQEALADVFNKFTIDVKDHLMWKDFLLYLGLLVCLPCIRHITFDESFLFVNPMSERTGKKSHFEFINKNAETVSKKIEAKVKYEKICQDLYSLYPQLLSKIVSIGQLQFMSPISTVIHITGGVELLITSGENNITLSAYMPSPILGNSSQEMNLIEYLWSVLYLCIDAFDALLNNQDILSLKNFSINKDTQRNYSVCYAHNWFFEGEHSNVCSMCGNCSSIEGINCPYNRISSERRGTCLCLKHSRTCADCGICPSCAKMHWTNNCESDPRRLMLFDAENVIIPHITLNVPLSSEFTIDIYSEETQIFVGLSSPKFDYVIDIFGSVNQYDSGTAVVTKVNERNPTKFRISSLSFMVSELHFYKPNLYDFSLCSGIDVIQELGILTYHANSNVGLVVGKFPVSPYRNKFAIEITNPGEFGRITIGLVPEGVAVGQPGWYPNSLGYHGDDGGIFLGDGKSIIKTETFSKSGNRIEVIIEYEKSASHQDNRFISWFKNGELIYRTQILNNEDLFPAIGMHSVGEQCRLLHDSVWQDNKLFKYVEEIPVNQKDISVSPEGYINMSMDSDYSGLLHVFPRNKNIKRLSFQILQKNISSKPINGNIKSLNNIPQLSGKNDDITFLINETTENYLSFQLSIPSTYNFSNWTLQMTALTMEGQSKIFKWRLASDLINWEKTKPNFPLIREVFDPSDVPAYPSFLLTTTCSSKVPSTKDSKSRNTYEKRFYHISRSNYYLFFEGNRRDAWIKSSNFVRPNFTRSFQVGNIIKHNSKPSLIVGVDRKAKEIKLTGQNELVAFNSPEITPSLNPGKPLILQELSKDGKFYDVTLITEKLLMSPPASRPWILLFQNAKDIPLSYLYYSNSCNEYHGMTICLLNSITQSQADLKRSNKQFNMIVLPLNQDKKNLSHFLFEHSFIDLISWKNILFYPICMGTTRNYESKLHLIDVEGLEVFNKDANDQNAYKAIFYNPSLLQAHKLLLNHKILLPKSERMFPQAVYKFSESHIEFLLTSILEKITGFMVLSNLLSNRKFEFNEDLDINLNKFFENENDRSLILNSSGVCCKIHSPDHEEINLDEIYKDQDPDSLNNVAISSVNNSIFKYAKFAQLVVISGKNIRHVPEEFFLKFANLKSLEFRNMFQLEDLPQSIYNLKGLQNLLISFVKIKSFPDIWKFPNLKSFEVMCCPLTDHNENEGCDKVYRLQTINLVSLPLTKFPLFLCDAEKLASSKLQLHGLESLPPEFGNLKNLKDLEIIGSPLYYDMVKDEFLLQRENVNTLYPEIITYNVTNKANKATNLHPFSEVYVNVPRIGSGYSVSLDALNHGGFPSVIFQLRQLTSLNIHHQSIRFIPGDIRLLENLEVLNMSHNPLLEKIAPEISLIKSMNQLILTHCPSLTVPPLDVVGRGSQASLSYLKYLQAKSVLCNRTKLMIVGLGEAGKTSLLYALTSPNNCARQIIENNLKNVTDGIDIGRWIVSHNNETIEYSTWDFAGQDVYYNTHQFFLSPKGIYIVVWSVRQGIDHGDLDFWLSSISCHAKDAPIFVVGTRCDQVQVDCSCFQPLKKRYPQIIDFKLVDSFSGTGIEDLKTNLYEVTLGLPYMHQDIPSTILELENKCVEQRVVNDYITTQEFEAIALAEGVQKNDMKNVIQILHDFGSIQYFDTDMLKNYIVIKPQWIVDIMSKVVSIVNAKIKNGVFYHKDTKDVWGDLDSKLLDWMLNLTVEFDLTFPHPTIFQANIVPCLLTEEEPNIQWPNYDATLDWKCYYVNYKFQFLPAGLFSRIQVRLLDFTEAKSVWKFGMYFEKNNHYILFKREKKNWLTIRALGVRAVNVLSMVDDIIKGLIKISFHGIHYTMEISCPDCIEITSSVQNLNDFDWNKIAMLPSKTIKKAIDKKVEFLQCSELHLNSMKSIKDSIPEAASAEKFINDLLSKLQTATSLYSSVCKSVTVLHSVKDFNEVSVLKPSQLDGILEELDLECYKINENSGLQWKESVSNCDVCLIILSNAFVEASSLDNVLEYVKFLNKTFLLVIISENTNIRKIWNWSLHFSSIYLRFDDRASVNSEKIQELKVSLRDLAFGQLEKEVRDSTHDCFISYCWSNSEDAVKKGRKTVDGAISSKADPRILCRFLKENNIKCWIDDADMKKNIGLNKQLSRNLLHSKVLVAFISKEYADSENCMMELNYTIDDLRKPVIFVKIGKNDFTETELGLVIRKKGKPVYLDFSNDLLVSNEQLLQTVKELLANTTDTPVLRKAKTEIKSRLAFLEHMQFISRSFLNHLSFLMNEHCPRLLVLDINDSQDPSTANKQRREEASNSNLCLKTICENDEIWHVVDQFNIPSNENKSALIENFAVYLYMIYEVLKYKNPGLKCLQPNVIQDADLISTISQIAKTSKMSLEQSYSHMIKYFVSQNGNASICSLKRYRLVSGRDLWMCDRHAKTLQRCRLIEKDAILNESVEPPVDENDTNILAGIKLKMEEECKKYSDSFKSIVQSFQNCQATKKTEISFDLALQNQRKMIRSNTILALEKDMVTKPQEALVRPKISRKLNGGQESSLTQPGKVKENRQNLKGSRVCSIQ